MNQKSLIAFRATGVKNGQSSSYDYGSSGLDPGKLFLQFATAKLYFKLNGKRQNTIMAIILMVRTSQFLKMEFIHFI